MRKRVGIERAAAFQFLSDSGLQRRRFFFTLIRVTMPSSVG